MENDLLEFGKQSQAKIDRLRNTLTNIEMESFPFQPNISKRFDKTWALDKLDDVRKSNKSQVATILNQSPKPKILINSHTVHNDLYHDGQKKTKIKNEILTFQEENGFTFTPIITKNSKRLTKKYLDSANVIERLTMPTFNKQIQL